MIREILVAFEARLDNAITDSSEPGIGLNITAGSPAYGMPVATVPSAQLSVSGQSPGETERMSDMARYGKVLETVLHVFAENERGKWKYLDALLVLYGDDTGKKFTQIRTDSKVVTITWGSAVCPEPTPEIDDTTRHYIRQPVTFTWN